MLHPLLTLPHPHGLEPLPRGGDPLGGLYGGDLVGGVLGNLLGGQERVLLLAVLPGLERHLLTRSLQMTQCIIQ